MAKCRVCGKDVFEHSKSDVKECFSKAGISIKGMNGPAIVSEVRLSVTFNHKHGYIKYPGGEVYDSKDIELDMFRVALTSKNIHPPVEEEKEENEYE